MNKLFMLFVFALFSYFGEAQTLITYGNNTVSKDEFLRAYNKNKSPVENREQSVREYVNLYTNFKLKVKAAEQMKLDTSEQVKADMDNFRRQIEENYLHDEKAMSALMYEAFVRSQLDLEVVHFSIAVDSNASPADTVRAYTAIRELSAALKSGKASDESLASTFGVRRKELGFITVFSLPYSFENIVYALKPGESSTPYRGKTAWHVFKLVSQRQSAGKWKVAQILFSYPPDVDEATKTAIMHKADSVYGLLKGGAAFADMASTYSQDKLSYLIGGELPEFGTGKYESNFEKEVMSLGKDGDISRPFSSSFGVHIVKRIGHTPMPSDKNDANLQYDLKQQLLQDGRMKTAKEKFAKDVMRITKMQKSNEVSHADLFRYADTMMNDPMGEIAGKLPISKKKVLLFDKGFTTGADWLTFVRDFKTNPDLYKGEDYPAIWERYQSVAAVDFYRKNLEKYNPQFEYQLNEFREGNLLFEVMEKKVWSQAAKDTIGLKKYYDAHKETYTWAESADVLVVNAVSEAVAKATLAALQSGENWKTLMNAKPGEIQADSGRYELTQLNISTGSPAGTYSSIQNNADGTAGFMYYYRFYPPNQPRGFEDARGLVINDYQTVLEKEWVASLRKKYPVKVDEKVLQSIIK
jgi:peptidyl-prolyl cis-trans isomerase SurA